MIISGDDAYRLLLLWADAASKMADMKHNEEEVPVEFETLIHFVGDLRQVPH
jgi:hypothetical protein